MVYKVRGKRDMKEYVLKQIDMSRMRSKQMEESKKEAILMQKLDFKYIVKMYDSFVENKKINIIMEFC